MIKPLISGWKYGHFHTGAIPTTPDIYRGHRNA